MRIIKVVHSRQYENTDIEKQLFTIKSYDISAFQEKNQPKIRNMCQALDSFIFISDLMPGPASLIGRVLEDKKSIRKTIEERIGLAVDHAVKKHLRFY